LKLKALFLQFGDQAKAIFAKKFKVTGDDIEDILERIPKILHKVQGWFANLSQEEQLEIMAAAFVSKIPIETKEVSEDVLQAVHDILGKPHSKAKPEDFDKAEAYIKKWVASIKE